MLEFEVFGEYYVVPKRVSYKRLQALAGKLNWASSVVRGGRTYLRRILDLMKPVKHSRHKVKVTQDMRQDLLWWSKFLRTFNGKSTILYECEVHVVYVDACEVGGACFYKGDWKYVCWRTDYPHLAKQHINVKEGMMMLVAAFRWACFWAKGRVVFRTDNMTAAVALNKGTSLCRPLMEIVRTMFWIATCQNFAVNCVHLPGECNVLADALSRLHESEKLNIVAKCFAWHTLEFRFMWPILLIQHMSYQGFLFLVPQVLRWLHSDRSGHGLLKH